MTHTGENEVATETDKILSNGSVELKCEQNDTSNLIINNQNSTKNALPLQEKFQAIGKDLNTSSRNNELGGYGFCIVSINLVAEKNHKEINF